MQYRKGDSDQDLCHGGCHDIPVGATDLPPCHDPGSLSHDVEGSCESKPQGCQPLEPYPPQRSCDSSKPRRRVEVNHVQPICPPPAKIRRRPLQQYRPARCCQESECCGKPRRRVEQCPAGDARPPVILHPLPPQRLCPCVPCCRPPARRCCPAAVPLSLQHQQKQVMLVPPCLQKK